MQPTASGGDVAELVLELEIGGESGKGADYEFSSIGGVLIVSGGTMWVQDGNQGIGETPAIRLYSAKGRFLRQVGQVGDGPGEYRAPTGMALLPDGRVIVRDHTLSNRLTLYSADGAFSTTWPLERGYNYLGPDLVRVDTAGFVWLPFQGRPGRNRQPPAYLRLRPDGAIADTIPFPRVPEQDRDRFEVIRTFPSGNTQKVDYRVPYWPRARWAWSPLGFYAVTPSDRYRIEIHPLHAVRPGSAMDEPLLKIAEPAVIEKSVAPVEVPPAERAAIRSRLIERVSAINGSYDGEMPEIPVHKPPIRGLRYTDDGRLLVSVSMPSRQDDGAWSEPIAYDVFDREGRFMGRLILPDSFGLRGLAEDRLWGVVLGEYDVPSIRRYRIVWPQRD